MEPFHSTSDICAFVVLEGSTVWIDDEGVILDATLVKIMSQETPGKDTNIFDAVVHRMQIIFNVKTQMCHTWFLATTSNPLLPYTQYSMGNGDLKSAQKNFDRTFEQHTGLSWSNRHKDPIKGKFIFIPCCYEDEAKFSPATLRKDIAQLTPTFPDSVINVLNMVFGPNYKVKDTLASLSKGRLKINIKSVTEHTIQVGYALLNRICELPKNSGGYPSLAPDTAISLLSRCYFALMFANNRKIPTDSLWIERERELLQYLENLMALDSIMKSPLKIPKFNMLHLVHRKLQLPEINPCIFSALLAMHDVARIMLTPDSSGQRLQGIQNLGAILRSDNPLQANALDLSDRQGKQFSQCLLDVLFSYFIVSSSWRDAKCVHPSLQGIRMPDLYKKESIATNTTWQTSNEYVVCHSAQVHHRYLFHVKVD